MDFQNLVDVYEELENTSSGNIMREILSEFFKKVPKENIAIISYLTLGRIASEYENVVLGMAEKSVLKAIAIAGGTEIARVKKIMIEKGDVGLTAQDILKKKPQTLVPVGKLTIGELFEKLHKIANSSGSGSQDLKANTLAAMLQKSSAVGAKYLTRIILGTLRMGVGDMTVLDSLAIAYTGEKKNKRVLEKAYNLCPDVGVIAEKLVEKGLKGLDNVKIKVGRPIKMMLAQRVKDLDELAKKMPGDVSVEGKYDGERIQAHKDSKGKVQLFSRRLDNVTEQFPDLVNYLLKSVKAKEFIIEGEVLAKGENGKPLPFQILMQRRRKYDVNEYSQKIPVEFKVFDVLYFEGKNCIDEKYEKRSEILKKIVKKSSNVMIAEKIITSNVEEIDKFFHKMLDAGYEGIMIKSLTGEYQAGTRGWNWIKWKKEYVNDLSDTFDLVIVGAYHGKGRRGGVYGALLCAAYDDNEDKFLTICKLGTGLTDTVLEELPLKLKAFKVNKKPARLEVKKEMVPDVWFEPSLVVEVLAAELTKSPFHTLGYALRFPRFIGFREKNPEEATSKTEIEEMV